VHAASTRSRIRTGKVQDAPYDPCQRSGLVASVRTVSKEFSRQDGNRQEVSGQGSWPASAERRRSLL